MTGRTTSPARVPRHVAIFSRILKVVVAAGVPLGYNRIVTIRGRKTGEPRDVALAVVEVSGRRWVWAPWGDVNWVRNLRAAGRATIRDRGADVEVVATELDRPQRVAFFRDTLAPIARSIPLGFLLVRVVDGVDLNDPDEAADGRVAFELQPMR